MAFELRLRGKSTSHERVWGSLVTECGRSYVGSAVSQDVFEGLFFLNSVDQYGQLETSGHDSQ